MFRNRDDAAQQLAEELKPLPLRDPVVLAIPRGGVATGAVLARLLNAELDVALAHKLRAPHQPELAVGAVGEDGYVYLNQQAAEVAGVTPEYVEAERERQMEEINRRKQAFREVRPRAKLENRSVIVTDDGIATGSTMIAALEMVKGQNPHEVIVAVPVAPPSQLDNIRRRCDRLVCLSAPESFWAIGQFYEDFGQVDDEQALALLRESLPAGRETK